MDRISDALEQAGRAREGALDDVRFGENRLGVKLDTPPADLAATITPATRGPLATAPGAPH